MEAFTHQILVIIVTANFVIALLCRIMTRLLLSFEIFIILCLFSRAFIIVLIVFKL